MVQGLWEKVVRLIKIIQILIKLIVPPAGLPDQGLLVIDLDSLENPYYKEVRLKIDLDTIVDSLRSAHNLFIDENGVCYVFGSNVAKGGALLLDVATDPWNPEYLGIFNDFYFH